MTDHDLEFLIPRYARMKGVDLAPAWASFGHDEVATDASAVRELARLAGWEKPKVTTRKPKPHQLPLLAYVTGTGWVIADQWENEDLLRCVHKDGPMTIAHSDVEEYDDLILPDPLNSGMGNRALDVFVTAMKARKGVFISAMIATVAANIIGLVTSLYSMQVYDRVIPRSGWATLIALTVGALGALVLDFILRTTRALMIEREAAHMDEEISEFFFARAQSIRLDARPPQVGTMASQLRGMEQVRSMLSSTTLFVLADLPFSLFFVFVIAILGGVVAIVPLITFPISIVLAMLFARWIRKDTEKAQVSSMRKNGLLVETLDAAETIKANGGQWMMLGKWNALISEVHIHEDPVKRTSAMASSIFGSIQQVAFVIMIAVGAYETAAGNMTMGALIACSILSGRVNGPLIAALPGLIVQWGYTKSSLKMLDVILSLPTDDSHRAANLRPENLTGPIVATELSFSYPKADPTINIPRLEFRPGERVAIIGGIGSGKSTLLKLLAGLYLPTEGRVLVNNLDISHVAPDIARKHFGYIPQDSRLVNGTLKENLLLGIPDPGDDAIKTALEQTGLAAMVSAHPMGIGLPISEGGRGLSGGQRMLTALTRLVLANPPVLLLDEPTANLDQATEAHVLQSIVRGLKPESIMIMVTHKLQLLGLVQRVILLGGGQIVMDGPTQDVLNRLKEQAQQHQARQQPVAAVATS